jgi:hypothetical protein
MREEVAIQFTEDFINPSPTQAKDKRWTVRASSLVHLVPSLFAVRRRITAFA